MNPYNEDNATATIAAVAAENDELRAEVERLREALRLVVYVDRDLYRTEAQRRIIARQALVDVRDDARAALKGDEQ